MDLNELALTALRATAIYFFLMLVVRLLGKRTVGNFSAFDLIVALILGDLVSEPVYGGVPMAQALVALGVIAAWAFADAYLSCRIPFIERFIGGEARVLVRDGMVDTGAMAAEHISEPELLGLLREQDVEALAEVKLGPVELMAGGHFVRENMVREHISEAELDALLRMRRIAHRGALRRATLEPHGRLSIEREEPDRPAQRRDLAAKHKTGA
jgi:uncharacterized membrane protein YcaP (DUF421 family)